MSNWDTNIWTFYDDRLPMITYFIEPEDTTPPILTINFPISNSKFNLSNEVIFNITVTDNIGIKNVTINITNKHNSTIYELYNIVSTHVYNLTYTIPHNITGLYNVTISVFDTSGNENNSIKINFTVLDNINPQVNNFFPQPNQEFNTSQKLIIWVNVTDNIKVNNVSINITNSHNSTVFELHNLTNKYTYTYNYTISHNIIGLYNVTFIVYDEQGNLNNTVKTNFTVLDNINPQVNNIFPQLNQEFNTSQKLIIWVNVTDNIKVNTVSINITNSHNSTVFELHNLTNDYNYTYNYTISHNITGLYNVTFIVYDEQGNLNNTVKTNFTVLDNIPPYFETIFPSSESMFNTSQNITINITVLDNIQVNNLTLNITNSHNSTIYFLTNIGDIYSLDYTIPHNITGLYNLSFKAYDIFGNENTSNVYIAVRDEDIDLDGDGLNNNEDNLSGKVEDIKIGSEGIKITTSTNQSTWPSLGVLNINLTKQVGGNKLIEISKNLSVAELVFKNVIIERVISSNQNSFIINGLDLQLGDTKTLYFDLNSTFDNDICIKDEEIESINEISESCDGQNEFLFKDLINSIPNENDNISIGYVNISWSNFTNQVIRVVGLNHSAILQRVVVSKTVSLISKSNIGGIFYVHCVSPSHMISGKCIESKVMPIIENYENVLEDIVNNDEIKNYEIPENLFDISFTVSQFMYDDINELVTKINFENFGTESTIVNYTITLEKNNKDIFKFNKLIEVNTQELVLINFDEVFKNNNFNISSLKSGEYIVILNTNYGNNIKDKFIQKIILIDNEQKSETSSNSVLYFLLSSFGLSIVGLGVYKFKLFKF